MIYTQENYKKSDTFHFDVCIIGSGAGGSAAAWALSKKGLKVALIEAGNYRTSESFTQREDEMIPELFYDCGGRRTSDRSLRILHGKGVGGSTVHNINLCKRLPREVFDTWNLKNLKFETLIPFYDEIESLLHIRPIETQQINLANTLFKKGIDQLGYRGAILSHNRVGCIGSGFCELGCAYNAKMNALRVFIPMATQMGLEVFANTQAIQFEYTNRKIHSLIARTTNGHLLKFLAKTFISSAGAIEGPALLLRSRLPDPYENIGKHLHLHPGAAIAGVFEEKVESWKGVPQSYECTEFLDFTKADKRAWIIPSPAHPCGVASALPGFGSELREGMKLFSHLLPLAVMLHDESTGQVRARDHMGVKIDYQMNASDESQLKTGLKETARILFAAGAKSVQIPYLDGAHDIKNLSELDRHTFRVAPFDLDFLSVHPMSSLKMGSEEQKSSCDESGRYWQIDNLYVADTSLFPTSIGIPPQWSAYAMGLFVASQIRK